jgi:hypothetical protein
MELPWIMWVIDGMLQYVCNLHWPTLFGNPYKGSKKTKSNYYVAKCVIALFQGLFSLKIIVLISSDDMHLWGKKVFAVTYFLGYV